VLVEVSGSQARREPAVWKRALEGLPPEARVTVARSAEAVEVAPADPVLEPIPGARTDFSPAVEWAIHRRVLAGCARPRSHRRAASPRPPPRTFQLERPFLVVATQNPIEHEGTYPLPEAQLDRFMFCVRVGYPDAAQEAEIARTTTAAPTAPPQRVLTAPEIVELQQLVRTVPIADDVVSHAVRLAAATRHDHGAAPASPLVAQFVTYGVSPRASQYLVLGAKAHALLHGRLSVDFADVRALVAPVFRHRLVLNYRARAERITPDDVAAEVVKVVMEEQAPRAKCCRRARPRRNSTTSSPRPKRTSPPRSATSARRSRKSRSPAGSAGSWWWCRILWALRARRWRRCARSAPK
jgi:hypothetical protein